jgi:peptidylprolyl isomerase
MSARRTIAALTVAAAVVAGCGTNNADTSHIVPAPDRAQSLQFQAPPTIVTPKSGPLSAKPTVSVPSGAAPTTLKTKDLIKGTGAIVQAGDTVNVNYVGALYKGGKTFDSSWSRGAPTSFTLSNGSVIAGWVQGLAGMRVGGRRELIIPPSLGYGATAQSTIPANSTLIFIVDVLAISPPSGATGVTGATIAQGATGTTGATG